MASLKDRKNKEVNPAAKTVLDIAGQTVKKEKYPVNVVFDGVQEEIIKRRAKELGMGVATYIKMLVSQDLSK